MLKRSHIALGVLSALVVQHSPTLETSLLIGGATVGSVLPDLDLKLNIPHRTITHWLLWPALMYFFWGLWPFVFGLAIGWAAHILADCFTVGGLRPLWPVRFRFAGPIKTGTLGEFLFMFLAVGGFIYWMARGFGWM